MLKKEEKVIIGAFTADCVPVILVDEREGVIAAIIETFFSRHSMEQTKKKKELRQ